MKTSISKRIISLLLSVMMLATSLPFVSISASASQAGSSTEWTMVASSDFTRKGGASYSTSDNTTYTLTTPATSDDTSGVQLTWTAYSYNAQACWLDNFGFSIPDGYVYLSGSTEGKNPLNGLSTFKMDLTFQYYSSFTNVSVGDNNYCFMRLGTGTAFTKQTDKMWKNVVVSQSTSGKAYVNNNSTEVCPSSLSTDLLSTTSPHITEGSTSTANFYHYVLEYVRGYVRAYITDNDGNLVQTVFGYKCSDLNVNDINTLCFGDDDNSYYAQRMTYKNVKFYSGVDTTQKVNKDSSKTRYLFAYFTGQSDKNGEKLHFAVSKDGKNFEALNGNEPITSNYTPSAYYYNGDTIGTSASGYIRDPYILQARNSDGSVGKGYYILATDLGVYATDTYCNSKLLIWYVKNIEDINSAQPWSVETLPFFDQTENSDFRAWAPEAIWDDEKGMYMLYWSANEASYNGDGAGTQIIPHYAYTSDFKTFYNQNGEELSQDGVTADRLIEPNWNTDTTYDKAIDANITYDGIHYYLYFKRESEQQIYYCVADHANGPYSDPVKFSDSDYSSSLEGCQVYEQNDGTYTMLLDKYDTGVFLSYASSDLENGFVASVQINSYNINHLSPRHGAVTYISDDEYNALVQKYGKSTYCDSGLTDGSDVNDNLIARYFTTSDVTYDATGHGYTLTNAGTGVTASTDTIDGTKVATAVFTSNGATASSADSGSYAYVDFTQMMSDYKIDEKTGITFDWYGTASSTNAGRYFDLTNQSIGALTWDTRDNNESCYAYMASNHEFGARDCIIQSFSNSTNTWHHYTVTITHNYMNVYVDGNLLGTTYSTKDATVSTSGSPAGAGTSGWYFWKLLQSSTLRFSASSFGSDVLLDGSIADFRVYGRALSQDDITNSLTELSVTDNGADVDLTNRVYYDPMEDMDTTEDGSNDKTKYDKTVDDPQGIHGDVLNINGGTTSHNPKTYAGSSTKATDGYTISCFYNPGESIDGQSTIFNIGDPYAEISGSNFRYFVLLENGTLFYNDYDGKDHFIDLYNVFGDGNSLPLNEWTHIVFQIVPSAQYDIINVYFNGVLVNSIDTYTSSANKGNLDISGYSIHDYLASDNTISYGLQARYWYTSSHDEYLDDFAIYNGVYSAKSIFSNDCNAYADKLIDLAISTYQAKMAEISASNGVYTNMAPAYEAYDACARFQDALAYGNMELGKDYENSDIVTLYQNVITALDNMTFYTKPATKEGLSTSEVNLSSGSSIDAKYTQNMLSRVDLGTKYEITATTDDCTNEAIYSGSFVWLYDGETTPTAPIGGGFYTNRNLTWSTVTHYAESIYRTAGDIEFAGNWVFYNGYTDPQWFYETGTKYCTATSDDQTSTTFKLGTSKKWCPGSNYIYYTGKPSDTTYWTSTIPTYYGKQYLKWSSDGHFADEIIFSAPIYIINYVPVKNELFEDANIEVLNNVTEYNPSSIKSFLEAYDALTSFNYLFSTSDTTVSETTVKEMGEKLEALVTTLHGIDTTKIEKKIDDTNITDANGDSINVRNETATNSAYVTELIESNENTKYTTSSFTAYEESTKALEDYYYNLSPTTQDDEYATTEADILRFYENMVAAKDMLVEVADYTPVDDTVDNYSSKISTNNFSKKNKQDYTLTTWLDFTDNYAVAKSWADKDEDYRQDTEKYEIDYNKYEYGPYIAYDVNGNVVTSDSQTPYYYVFVGEFYETDTSTEPSQFETGDYAMIDGTLVKLNGHRYYGYSISDTYSARQQEIYDAQTNTDTANTNLAPVDSDDAYQNYTTAQGKFASADPEAFTTATVDTLNSYGSSTSADTYTGTDQDAVYVSYNGKIYKNTTTGETDDYTKNVLYAINGELDGVKTRNTHKVTFNYIVNGTTVNQFTDEEYYYGDTPTLTYTGDGKVVSWSVVRDNSANPYCISNTSSSYDLKVQTDSTVNVYITTDDSAKLEVQIKDYFGRAQVVYVDSGTVVTANGDTLEFSDGQSKTNQACNYITFNGFKIGNKALISATITEDTVITASGTKEQDTMTYTVDNGTFADNSTTAQYKVDDKIVITANSTEGVEYKGIALKTGDDSYVMLTYDTTYSFYAFPVIKAFNGTVEFKVMTADDLEKYDIDGVAPQSFGAGVYANGKLSMYCTMTTGLSSSVNIIERGVIASASANTEDTLVKGATGVKTFRSSTDVNSTQYLYSIKTSTNIYARSYVSYELKENINGVDVSIPLVSYGDIVSSADC